MPCDRRPFFCCWAKERIRLFQSGCYWSNPIKIDCSMDTLLYFTFSSLILVGDFGKSLDWRLLGHRVIVGRSTICDTVLNDLARRRLHLIRCIGLRVRSKSLFLSVWQRRSVGGDDCIEENLWRLSVDAGKVRTGARNDPIQCQKRIGDLVARPSLELAKPSLWASDNDRWIFLRVEMRRVNLIPSWVEGVCFALDETHTFRSVDGFSKDSDRLS